MHGLQTIKAINAWRKSHDYQKLAKALNNPTGHAKDTEKGRQEKTQKLTRSK